MKAIVSTKRGSTVTTIRLIANLHRSNILDLEQTERFTFRA